MKLIVLCGGYGTRLGDITKSIPKPLVPIGNKRIIDIALQNYKEYEYVFSAGHLAEHLQEYVRENYPGSKIYTESTKLGTGGAIKYCAEKFDDGYFGVINGDTISKFDLKEIRLQMVYDLVDIDCIVCEGINAVTGKYENAGAFVFNRLFLNTITRHLEDSFWSGRVRRLRTDQKFYDLGTPEGIECYKRTL